MQNTHFLQGDLNKIETKIRQVKSAYNELRTLGSDTPLPESFKSGFVLDAGKSTEAILKFICKRENIHPTVKGSGNKPEESRNPSLNDYLQAVREHKIISDYLYHHLDMIKRWRNVNAHDPNGEVNLPESTLPSTIESVNDSFGIFITWFYKNYLKDEVPDFAVPPRKENTTAADHVSENAAEVPEFSLNTPTPTSEERAVSSGNYGPRTITKWLIGPAVGIALAAILWIVVNQHTDQPAIQNRTMSPEVAYNLIEKYYSVCYSANFNAQEYFADTVLQFNSSYNQTPEQIKDKLYNPDIEMQLFLIDKKSLAVTQRIGNKSYWQFYVDVTYYQFSHRNNRKSREHVEIGFDGNSKIISFKGLDSELNF